MQITYSDGSIEKEVLRYLKQHPPDHMGDITKELADGAVFHNFTEIRENLISWYPFRKGSCVLEIGAGMGALTGALCRKCGEVVALEASDLRADIIRERYKGTKNLAVITSDISAYEPGRMFDYITLIGVLEYIGIGQDVADPYGELLAKCHGMLKPGGQLLLAIENRFGLKYWCGAAEDHTGVPFSGINGYEESRTGRYNADGVRTFSKNSLEELLAHAGFMERRFYYPLPDYKFPSAVFSDDALPDEGDIRAVKFMYPMESELVADERRLYPEVIKNGQFPFFANSFLVIAGKETLPMDAQGGVLSAYFKRDYRKQYQTVTLIKQGMVLKKALGREASPHLDGAARHTEELAGRGVGIVPMRQCGHGFAMDLHREPKASEIVKELFLQNAKGQVMRFVRLLEQDLKKSSPPSEELNPMLKGMGVTEEDFSCILKNAYIDMTFINSFLCSGGLLFFDQEWCFHDLPVEFVLYRALVYVYPHNGTQLALDDIFSCIGVTARLEDAFSRLEDALLTDMLDGRACHYLDALMYREELEVIPKARTEVNNLRGHVSLLMQTENEQKNQIGQLGRALEERQRHIEQLSESERSLRQELNDKQGHIELLLESERSLQQELKNKQGHIELLLGPERELVRIKGSRTWRVASGMQRVSSLAVPPGSLRRLAVKVCAKLVRHPVRSARMLTPGRVRHFLQFLRQEGAGSVSRRIDMSMPEAAYQQARPSVDLDIGGKAFAEYAPLLFPETEGPDVSVIIPAYNQFPYTYGCLKSILEHTGSAVSYEVIVADDCSTDDTVRLGEIAGNVRVIRNGQNLLFLKNCNHAAGYARGRYLLFLNNDTQVQENWLEPLVRLLDGHADIGMAGSKLIYPDGRLQEAGGIIWRDGSAWNYGNRQEADRPEYNYVKDVDYVSGASLMVRRGLWEEIGGFDERYAPAYCEDSDLAFEVRGRGCRVVYQPQSVVVHFEGVSNGTDTGAGVKRSQLRNSQKLAQKWAGALAGHYPNGQHVFRARERSQGKPMVLFIDHYVPQYDQDAGSRTVYQYLQMFVRKGFQVKFIGDNFYRHEPYASQLEQLGIEVLYGSHYQSHVFQWLDANKEEIDFVFMNRPHISIKYIDYFYNKAKAKVIYYGHDLHFLRCQREYGLTGDSAKGREAEEWKKKELYLMERAAVSYYPSRVEVGEVHKLRPDLQVKAVTAYIYDAPLGRVQTDFAKRDGVLFVGGFVHGPNVDAVRWFVSEIWPLVRRERDMAFYIVGSHAPKEVLALDGEDGICVKGYLSEGELQGLYQTCRLAAVPLRYGAGVKGKVIEAAYYGLPVVTTSVGAEGIQEAGAVMQVADGAQAFADALLRLYGDEARLAEMSGNTQAFIAKYFSMEAAWRDMEADFTVRR